jgi:hypothetical protein
MAGSSFKIHPFHSIETGVQFFLISSFAPTGKMCGFLRKDARSLSRVADAREHARWSGAWEQERHTVKKRLKISNFAPVGKIAGVMFLLAVFARFHARR